MGTEQHIQVPITKIDDEQHLFGGWAYQTHLADGELVVDHSGDVVDTPEAWAAMKDAFVKYALVGRAGNEMHVDKVSELVEFFVSDREKWGELGIPEGTLPTGVYVSYHTADDEVWGKVKDGTYRSLSIGGTGTREVIDA